MFLFLLLSRHHFRSNARTNTDLNHIQITRTGTHYVLRIIALDLLTPSATEIILWIVTNTNNVPDKTEYTHVLMQVKYRFTGNVKATMYTYQICTLYPYMSDVNLPGLKVQVCVMQFLPRFTHSTPRNNSSLHVLLAITVFLVLSYSDFPESVHTVPY